MALELVHRLATDDSPAIKKILDNVIFAARAEREPGRPDRRHRLVQPEPRHAVRAEPAAVSRITRTSGHDSNRDMYMFTQKESQYIAQLAWHDWFPAVWLDQHQMGTNGPRMFVMPATDPINPNVHPLIYRWNGILGQSQAAALEAAGKDGIIYNSTYTNFWQGAMAWSGWWHNQIGLLTEVASVRVAAPVEQLRATPGTIGAACAARPRRRLGIEPRSTASPLAAADRHRPAHRVSASLDGRPLDAPRHRRLRAHLDDGAARDGGGSPRDASPADLRGQSADGRRRPEGRRRRRSWCRWTASTIRARRRISSIGCRWAASRCIARDAPFEADGRRYAAGTFVIPMTQVFARYAKDLLEKQTYPEVRRGPDDADRAARTTSPPGRSACCSASTSTSSERRTRRA